MSGRRIAPAETAGIAVAVAGAGFMAQTHLDSLVQVPHAHVVGVADRTVESAGRGEAVSLPLHLSEKQAAQAPYVLWKTKRTGR